MDYSSKNISSLVRLGMRKAFGHIMCDVVNDADDIVVLAADVASSASLDVFAGKYPEKFYNVGIAEQNMVGIAAGLAKEGANVFVISFAPFISMRAYEAIRTLVGYMKLNVKIIGLASGFSLGAQGNTHYSFEDISLMRSIPDMLVMSPVDVTEEMKCLEMLKEYKGPAYLRLTGIDGTPCLYKEDYNFNPYQLQCLKEGTDVAIVVTGSVGNECVRATRALKKDGISASVYNAHTLKPFDYDTLDMIAKKYKQVYTVEEHSVIGGLGSIVSDAFASMENHPKLYKIGINDCYLKAGDYSYLLNNAKLSALNIRDYIVDNYIN